MSETRTVFDPFELKAVEISNRLVDRLRGKYASGPHLPNGNPEFGWRQFEAPPIQHEAADAIEAKDAEIASLRAQLAKLEAEKEAGGFWRGVFDDITDKTDREKIEAELSDYNFVMQQVPDVYMHITGGKMSKCNYYAHTVIAEADEYSEKFTNEAADEARRKAIEDAANTAEQHSRLDIRCKCGFEIAEDIRALLSESKT